MQVESVDFTGMFAPVTKFSSIRTLLAITAKEDLEIHQMDVKSAFLNGDLEGEIFMECPPGFRKDKTTVWNLWKSLYGLKQASCEWYKKLRTLFGDVSYTRSDANHGVFFKWIDSEVVVIAIYVDDMLIFTKTDALAAIVKKELGIPYKMKDLGHAHWILGMQIERDRACRTITLSQRQYAKDILKKHRMSDCCPVSTPMATNEKLIKVDEPEVNVKVYQSTLGSLMYIMLGTRPNLAFAVGALSKHAACLSKDHWNTLMRVYRYLRHMSRSTLVYDGSSSCSDQGALVGFTNADWAGDVNGRRSVSGHIFLLSNAAVSWQLKKQTSISQSSTEAEYAALASAAEEALWIRMFLSQIYGMTIDAPGSSGTLLLVGNQSAMAPAKNSTFHNCTKHIAVCHHFV